jgi:hypothetical protein
VNCWTCAATIDEADAFCRRCGMGQGKSLPWYYEPVWIVVLTLFALGPLSLPLIWKSPRLSKRGRLIATGLVLLFTAYLALSLKRTLDLIVSHIQIPA